MFSAIAGFTYKEDHPAEADESLPCLSADTKGRRRNRAERVVLQRSCIRKIAQDRIESPK